jgi:hypothetical protein
VGVVTPQILNEDIRCIRFGREAVVTDVHSGVGDPESVYVERVESVRVLGQCLSRVRSNRYIHRQSYRGVGRVRIDKHVVEGNIVAAHEEVGPAGRVQLRDALDADPRCVVREEQNGPVERIVGILFSSTPIPRWNEASYQNLRACEIIVPLLTISIQRALAKNLDILATPNPEGD